MDAGHEIGLGLTIKQSVELETTTNDDQPEVSVQAELIEGRYVCTEILVRQRPELGLTSETLRSISVGFYVQWAAEACNQDVEGRLTEAAMVAVGLAGRIGDDLLAAVAATYRWGYAVTGNPTAKIMEVFSIKRPRAAAWVARARERGLLGPTEMGRPGGVTS